MDYKKILEDAGFQLRDGGHYWQTNAVFRNGDNSTAIRIYKDSGVWQDFVAGDNKSFPFAKLIQITTGQRLKQSQQRNVVRQKKLLSTEKTYPEKCLGRLLPDLSFFQSRGISEKVQNIYKCGVATNGPLYNRVVFPIYQKDNRIHGFTGRSLIGDNKYKWLHHGKTRNWFYPYFTIKTVRDKIESSNCVFLIESIGDSMALYQAGFENNLVLFTNSLSPTMMSRLLALNKNIIIALNNDERGILGAAKTYLKLYKNGLDIDKLWFELPEQPDFGDMQTDDIQRQLGSLILNKETHRNHCEHMIGVIDNLDLPQSYGTIIRKYKKEFKSIYE